ncbi:amino acid permease [Pedobacter antarcticus]|uniref:Amino acid permease n=2 Tax=Pedobacter antarcticus TaxID=34086 RepID=A0A081PI88_9SPHI|nr:amino acid permease [Pedobacter antarcticus]KEQ30411.1 amino acid permease [Pedobacter antarcticus 4BY]SDM07805.1 amino acid/polyamine/organocation transporter, APC superfamily [Pedobacter antarcticus]SFF41742.1 amino acid/polyamine/organocation transporter, APC superfamily [Pedobacter antarcticus]
MFENLFRKKSVAKILEDAEKGYGDHESSLHKTLTVRDLTAFGIAAIIGAGIFSTIGKASADGGPAVIFLFIFTAIACSFAAFAYAEFASMVPVSGSAYTYSYVAFGEIVAWIIGWSLIMEYAIGNITVAISWSDYLTGLLSSIHIPALGIKGIHLPDWMTMDYLSAYNGHQHAEALINAGKSYANLDDATRLANNAWITAPRIGNFHIVADLPALFIIILITWLVYRGMKESKNASNAMVVVKLAVIMLVLAVGVFYVDTANWDPFAPNGVSGVLKGVSAVFFAYIGFDAISTTAEECKDPQRDLPRGMMWAIIICTVLYVAIALVLTGIVKYDTLAVGDPLAFVFDQIDMKVMSGIIAVSAVFAMASVLLVFQMGQPRIWMSMSRDGLLPKRFSKIHPVYKTPSFATIVVGFVVAVPSLFMNLTIVTDLCSIGTLFAFVLVCAGVLVLQNRPDVQRGKFRIPYVNSKFIIPVVFIALIVLGFTRFKEQTTEFVTNKARVFDPVSFITSLDKNELNNVQLQIRENQQLQHLPQQSIDTEAYLAELSETEYQSFVSQSKVADSKKIESGWGLFKHKIPMYIFLIICVFVTYYCITKNLSLIPVLGLLSCLYMMCELGISNWIGFGIWLFIGLIVYFLYGAKHSKLNAAYKAEKQ